MPADILALSDYDSDGVGIAVREATHSSIAPHTHSFYELVYIKSGFCLHETANRTELLIEGDFFLMKPGQWHRYIGPHAVELYNCMFDKSLLAGMFDGQLLLLPGVESGTDETYKLHLELNEQKRVVRQLKGIMYDMSHKAPGWQVKAKCLVSCLVVDYSRAYENFSSARSDSGVYPNYVVGALEIISREYRSAELTVSGIAGKVGVTPDYLSRQFRMLTGVGAQEYIRRFRFSKAAELLMGGVSVSDTCREAGFSNLCHFSREFKKELGVSPSQYTKLNT